MQGTDVMRQQTQQFIKDNPTDLVITRRVRVSDGAGGFTTTPTDLSPQEVRIVQQPANESIERRNSDGEVVRPVLKVLGRHDADFQMDDTFTWNGMRCEIVWVTVFPYEKVAEVAAR